MSDPLEIEVLSEKKNSFNFKLLNPISMQQSNCLHEL